MVYDSGVKIIEAKKIPNFIFANHVTFCRVSETLLRFFLGKKMSNTAQKGTALTLDRSTAY